MSNICEKCNGEIPAGSEFVCIDCGKKYHRQCWMSEGGCPSCRTSSPNSSGMFANIGGKIKGLAIFATVVGIIAGIIVFISMVIEEEVLLGLLVGAVIAISSWIGSFVIYGFGESITTSQSILRELKKLNERQK